MNSDRRKFLKRLATGAAAVSLAPSLLSGYTEGKAKGKYNATYPRLEFDVAVVGAGPGGVPAAIAAARQGAKVVLIEEDSMPGGAPVDMFVTFICGGPRVGIFREMIQHLNQYHTIGGKPVESFGEQGYDGKNHWWMPESYAQTIYHMLEQEPNITLMCGAMVVDTLVKENGNRNKVEGVVITRNGEYQEIGAKMTIDATGNGFVAASAGCEYMYGSEAKSDLNEHVGMDEADGKVQPCTWMMISNRIKRNAILPVDKFIGSSTVEDNLDHWVTVPDIPDMIRRDAGIYLHWGKTVYCDDTRDPQKLAEAQRKALVKLRHNMQMLHEAGYGVYLAPKLGVRECRRVKGEYILTSNDIAQGVFPDDTVAHAHYGFDVWGMKIPEELKGTQPYGIPYRSLIPLNTEGLVTAGRIISSSRIAHSSVRVQPICANIGEAAGVAAALAVKHNTNSRGIDVKKLQAILRNNGLFSAFEQ
ncbi:MAG: FAD-dependent oxidoreductase [Prevotellaceae bacterium]|nr:FAD-dependent oxidoreductase [Prevotellaceae bacterium]